MEFDKNSTLKEPRVSLKTEKKQKLSQDAKMDLLDRVNKEFRKVNMGEIENE